MAKPTIESKVIQQKVEEIFSPVDLTKDAKININGLDFQVLNLGPKHGSIAVASVNGVEVALINTNREDGHEHHTLLGNLPDRRFFQLASIKSEGENVVRVKIQSEDPKIGLGKKIERVRGQTILQIADVLKVRVQR